jgi:hypothetical protein
LGLDPKLQFAQALLAGIEFEAALPQVGDEQIDFRVGRQREAGAEPAIGSAARAVVGVGTWCQSNTRVPRKVTAPRAAADQVDCRNLCMVTRWGRPVRKDTNRWRRPARSSSTRPSWRGAVALESQRRRSRTRSTASRWRRASVKPDGFVDGGVLPLG